MRTVLTEGTRPLVEVKLKEVPEKRNGTILSILGKMDRKVENEPA